MAPRLIELCFQAAGLWLLAKKQTMGLPTALERAAVYRPEDAAEEKRLYVTVEARGDGEAFDARVVDEKGLVYAEVAGYRTVALPGRRTLRAARGAAMKRSFSRVAIVNRGEAALRFIHAALELNREGERLRTIALYTEPDRRALFVREADEACGPRAGHGRGAGRRAPEVAYLDLARLERRAAPDPGRGGLAGLGLRGRGAGVRRALRAARRRRFIGPSPAAMRALGDKIAGKRLADEPRHPGRAVGAARPRRARPRRRGRRPSSGFPVVVKAAGGIGGRGVREAETPGTLAAALEGRARRGLEAGSAWPPSSSSGASTACGTSTCRCWPTPGAGCGRCPRARRRSSGATRSWSRSRPSRACPRRARRRCARPPRASCAPPATSARRRRVPVRPRERGLLVPRGEHAPRGRARASPRSRPASTS